MALRHLENRIHRASVIAATVLGLVLSAGCAGGAGAHAPMPTGAASHDQQLLRGRSVYVTRCASCHGADGGGAVGPEFRGGRLQRDLPNPGAQVQVVARGRDGMPAFGGRVSEADIEAVMRYVREVLAR